MLIIQSIVIVRFSAFFILFIYSPQSQSIFRSDTMCCLDNLEFLMGLFATFVTTTHLKRREFFAIQKKFGLHKKLLSEMREGHLGTCSKLCNNEKKIEECFCKEYIKSTPKELITEIVDTIAVPYAMRIAPMAYLNRYTDCRYCSHS